MRHNLLFPSVDKEKYLIPMSNISFGRWMVSYNYIIVKINEYIYIY